MTLLDLQGVGARRGVVISSARALETGASVSCVVFDKTGTLTQGKPKVLYRLLLPEEGTDGNTCVNTDVRVSAAERRIWAGAYTYMFYTHKCTYTNTHVHIHTYTFTHTHILAHTYTHAHTYTYYTHPHTHTHTTQALPGASTASHIPSLLPYARTPNAFYHVTASPLTLRQRTLRQGGVGWVGRGVRRKNCGVMAVRERWRRLWVRG